MGIFSKSKSYYGPKCAGCGTPAPAINPNVLMAGYMGFGRCEKCNKIWCKNCDKTERMAGLIYHKCPICGEQLKN